jgi:hypothetical protein
MKAPAFEITRHGMARKCKRAMRGFRSLREVEREPCCGPRALTRGSGLTTVPGTAAALVWLMREDDAALTLAGRLDR